MNSPHPTPKPLKPVLFGFANRGGLGTTYALTAIADALTTLGHKVRYIDGGIDLKLSAHLLDQGIHEFDPHLPATLDSALRDCAHMIEDIAIIDVPTGYFRESRPIQGKGIQPILAVLPDPHNDSEKYPDNFPLIAVHTSLWGNPPISSELLAAAENRLIEIPKMSQFLRKQYERCPGPPSDYLAGGPAAATLGLSEMEHIMWRHHAQLILDSVKPLADFLIHPPAPTTA